VIENYLIGNLKAYWIIQYVGRNSWTALFLFSLINSIYYWGASRRLDLC